MGSCCSVQGSKNPYMHDQSMRLEEFHSKLEKFMEQTYKESSINMSVLPSKHLLNKQSQDTKQQFHQAIMQNNISVVQTMVKDERISICEELGTDGYLWISLHFACHFDRVWILKFLLNYIYKNLKQQYIEIVNMMTIEGWTPLMICCIYENIKCLKILLEFGGIQLDTKGGSQNKTALELAQYFQSNQCKDYMTKYQNLLFIELRDDKFDKKGTSLPTSIDDQLSINAPLTTKYDMDIDEYMCENKGINLRILSKTQLEQNANFNDYEFSHDVSSICINPTHKLYKLYSQARWIRLNELFNKDQDNLSLFEVIDANIIKQGNLSVSYLIAVFLALTEYPNRIKNIFNNKKINPLGIYSVNIYVDGEPKEILLDDYFPCFSDRNEHLFVKTKCNSCWSMFLEKAWAKTLQNYVSSEKMVVEYCMEDILGAPSQGYWVSNFTVQEILNFFEQIKKNDFINIVTSNFDIKKEDLLISGHAYTVLDIRKDKDQNNIIVIRNPWGKVYEEQKAADSQVELDDNTISLKIEEFVLKFQYFSICFVADNFHYEYVKFTSNKKHANYCMLDLQEETTISIRLHQPLRKRQKFNDYSYSISEFKLFQVTSNGQIQVISEGHMVYRNYGNKSVPIDDKPFLKLKTGKYIIRAKLFWKQGQDVVISTYSDNKVVLRLLPEEYGKKIMKEYYIYKVQQMNFTLLVEPGYYMASCWDSKYRMLLAFQNRNQQESTWETLIDISGKENVKFSGLNDLQDSLFIQIGQNQTEIIIIKPIDIMKNTSFIWQLTNKYIENGVSNQEIQQIK